MTLPTCAVTCSVADDTGAPLAGATITARLDRFEVYNGYVVPELVEVQTDATGAATLNLWPNELGATQSSYTVRILAPNGKTLRTTATVPNVPTIALHLIAGLPAYEGKPEGQLVIDAAVAAVAPAVAAKEAAEDARDSASGHRLNAQLAQQAAQDAADLAEAAAVDAASSEAAATSAAAAALSSQQAAATSAQAAADAQDLANSSAEAAAGHATGAAGSATEALASEQNAQDSATAAQSAQQAAALSASAASTSASQAAASAQTAATRANEAGQAKGIAESAATAAQASASAAQSSATAAADSASLALSHKNAALVAGDISTASATSASASAISASESAQDAANEAVTATAQAGIATTQASIATTQAGLSLGSAQNAAAEAVAATTQAGIATTQAGIATTQAGIATTQAGTATTQAGVATTQAGIATTQAGIATTKAGEALSSANAAAASYDSFDDRYLGAKSSAPTVDNDGQALLTGALYWDTTQGALRVWTGSAWTNTTELDDRVLADQQLMGAIAYITDLALKSADGVSENRGTVGSTDRAELFALMIAELFEKVGVIGRAIGGGTIELQAGTAAIPSLMADTDVDTGIFWPAANALGVATGGVERVRVTDTGRVGIGTKAPSGLLDINDNKLRVRTAQTPASATAAGNAGEVCWDASFLYVCVATNSWKRAALSTW